MTAKLGLLALLEAKPDKGDELGAFLEAGRALAGTRSRHSHVVRLQDQRHHLRHRRLIRDARTPAKRTWAGESPPPWGR